MKLTIKFIIAFCVAIYAFSVAALAANYLPVDNALLSISPGQLVNWFSENWVQVSLVISEAAALVSSKHSGIIRIGLNVIGSIFKSFKKFKS